MSKKALGRGLDILFTAIEENNNEEQLINLNISQIEPNHSQPRKTFDEEKLITLSESIKIHGIIQPIVVKKLENDFYQIIAGERRWRAARIAGIKEIPVIIKDLDKKEVLEIALIENLQREDLNPLEESEAYKNLIEEFGLTQEQISERVGKSRSAIANSLRLFNLSDIIKQMLIENKLSVGHARALLAIENINIQNEIAQQIISKELNVRQTEKLIKEILINKKSNNKKEINRELNYIYVDIQNRLSESLGTKVKILPGKEKSKIEIEYYSDDELERIMSILEN